MSDLDSKVEVLVEAAAEAQHKRYCRICEDALDRLDCRQLKRFLADARSLAAAVREAAYERGVRDAAGKVAETHCHGVINDGDGTRRKIYAAILALLSSPEKPEEKSAVCCVPSREGNHIPGCPNELA